MQPATATSCKSREILRNRTLADLKGYREAVEVLDGPVLRLDARLSFDQAVNDAEIARRPFEAVRKRFNRHIASHGCE
jgi:hypothetical protein